MNKNIPNSRPFFQGAQILGSPDVGPRIYTQFQVKRIHFPWAIHTVNRLLRPPPPPSQISSPSNKPPFPFKPLLPSPPLPLLFFTNLWYTIFINHNCNTSCVLVHDSFFHQLDFQICFWSWAAWPTTVVLELLHFAVIVLYGELIPSSLLNYVCPPLSNVFETIIEGLR